MRKTKVIGRILRLSLGIFFVSEVWPVYQSVTLEGILIRASWAVALLLFYIIVQMVIVNFFSGINHVVGAILAFAPFLAVFILGYGGPAATGALSFLSVSLIVSALRSDSGCEVMSVPGLIFGKHTHLACILFSPVDWIEGVFTK